jgi:hypothetical protein
MNQLHLIYEDFKKSPKQPTYDSSKCVDCGFDLKQDTYFYYCEKCGTIDFDKPIYVDHEWVPSPMTYKRRLYCMDKLNLMSGKKQSRSKIYHPMIKELKQHDFKNLKELKHIMKTLKYHKYYKFIYSIWFDIKGTKLITLTYNQIDLISRQFVELESKFKQSDKHSRKNMLNYNSLIYILLKKNKIKGYKSILLPFNHIVMIKLLKRFM